MNEMIKNRTIFAAVLISVIVSSWGLSDLAAQNREVPDALKPWEGWVTWSDEHRRCPTLYHSADEHICIWPSRLALSADEEGGTWNVTVVAFAETWAALPGSADAWPIDVKDNQEPIAVVERNGSPAIQLSTGRHEITGRFQWERMPQRITVPPEIGILSLTVERQTIAIPTWDANGQVWLKRARNEEAQQDLLAAQVYRVIQDGIPTWLLTEIEVTVSGKSREENLGWILPQGFKLSTVDSPIPVAVDDQGRMKAQVRAGKWTISARAFRTTSTGEIQFADGSQPITSAELVAFQAKPDFRLAEIEGLSTIDVTQTTFPEKWRQLPVYEWDTSSTFQLNEKMRGMGRQRPEGLSIQRHFWLDEDGRNLTYQDQIRGPMQQIWRLDVAAGQELGAVRVDGKGQLITANPQNGSHGVEIRSRNLNLEAIGRIGDPTQLPATGWQTDVDSLSATFILPPGWRALAVFGVDSVDGDWLTAWSLLDLFLLLIFTLAVYRIWGFKAGVVAFIAFGLAYHEPGSPRVTWLFLLIPIALLKVVPEGMARKWINVWKYAAIGLLAINLIPFLARQIQTAIYPQLERPGVNFASRGMFGTIGSAYKSATYVADVASAARGLESQQEDAGALLGKQSRFEASNLGYDPQARIQTGPAQPQWSWNIVQCSWDGPVAPDQMIKPILISRQSHRILTVSRVLLLVLLGAMLLGVRKIRTPSSKAAAAVAFALITGFSQGQSMAAEIPDQQILDTLRKRLLEPADVYPRAAEIAAVSLTLDGDRVKMESEIHSASDVAVPLPGRLPLWSPISVTVGEQAAELVCRKDGYLWIVLPKGVHRVNVESKLADVSDWAWTFQLKPRRVTVSAPGWNVTGLRDNRVPDQQLFFSRQQATTEGAAAYDRKDFNTLIAVDRHLEIGLVWQVRTKVTRLSTTGKAVSLKVPLLPDESVLSSNVDVTNGQMDVSLGAGQREMSWRSEIPVGSDIRLTTTENDSWIERWHLITSPVWNVAQTGLTPVFEAQQENMIPVWHPWPGEEATLSFNRPEAVSGDILTVQRVDHTVFLGSRQRTAKLKLDVECSIGSDFVIDITSDAAISSLSHDGQTIPARRDGEKLIIPVRPGKQSIEVTWKANEAMATTMDSGQVRLPVEGYNATTVMHVPESRWVLWADGPLRGPAVRFWTILVSAILIALVLGRLPNSPLGHLEWVLLAIGLTQVHVVAALVVVAWLFLLERRGKADPLQKRPWLFNTSQLGLVFFTFIALAIFVVIVGSGLLGNPRMFIVGNQSTRTVLNWFQPRTGQVLPLARVVSVSVWFYRLLMLFWALWLAASLIRWLNWGWAQFSSGGVWRRVFRAKPIETA